MTRLMGSVLPPVVDAVDLDTVLEHIDVNALLDRIDIDKLLDRIDVDHLIQRIDLDALLAKVDMNQIVQRADIAGIVSQSTKGIGANTLDLVRRQIVGIDEIVTRIAGRIMRRDPNTDPAGPPRLAAMPVAETPPAAPVKATVSGHYAGPLARLAAFAFDEALIVFLFGLATSVLGWTIGLFAKDAEALTLGRPWSAILFGLWWFSYFAISLAIAGRTLGKGLVGLRVVRGDGAPLGPGQAVLRTLVLPISILVFGLGLIGGVIGRRRRTWHDIAAGSTEVIDWGDRPAALPSPLANWVERHQPVEASA